MLERILSGGQTGADQAGWRAARGAGLATGGRMPRGFATEDGPRPEFAALYGAVEDQSADPAVRTVANVQAADGTLIFAGTESFSGTALTIATCQEAGLPHLVLPALLSDEIGPDPDPATVAVWIEAQGLRTLNVAGDRESHAPGLGARVEAFLTEVFRLLARPGLEG